MLELLYVLHDKLQRVKDDQHVKPEISLVSSLLVKNHIMHCITITMNLKQLLNIVLVEYNAIYV